MNIDEFIDMMKESLEKLKKAHEKLAKDFIETRSKVEEIAKQYSELKLLIMIASRKTRKIAKKKLLKKN